MYTIWGLVCLLFFISIRPQEVFPILRALPVLHLLAGATMVGLAVDARLGIVRLRAGPLLPWVSLLFGWMLVTLVLRAPHALTTEIIELFVSYFIFVALSQGAGNLRAISRVTLAQVAIVSLLSFVGIAQAFAPTECAQPDPLVPNRLIPDGRSCEVPNDCKETVFDLESEQYCEHVGPLETVSIEGRIRYRGLLEDPNELVQFVTSAVPFVFAAVAMRPTLWRYFLAGLFVVAVGMCTVYTQSRGGQLGFLLVIGIYALHRLRGLGVVIAAIAALPVLALGGRSGASAGASSTNRLEAWLEGIAMFRGSPLFGVGKGQFTDYHFLTAHNSFIQTLAELGLPGALAFTAAMYMAAKWLLSIMWRIRERDDPHVVIWALAIGASLACVLACGFFLSSAYRPVLWTAMGLSGAIIEVARVRHPDFSVRFRWYDALAVVFIAGAVTSVVYGYAVFKGA